MGQEGCKLSEIPARVSSRGETARRRRCDGGVGDWRRRGCPLWGRRGRRLRRCVRRVRPRRHRRHRMHRRERRMGRAGRRRRLVGRPQRTRARTLRPKNVGASIILFLRPDPPRRVRADPGGGHHGERQGKRGPSSPRVSPHGVEPAVVAARTEAPSLSTRKFLPRHRSVIVAGWLGEFPVNVGPAEPSLT